MPGFARTEVRRHGGVPTLFVEGRPLHGMTATSCALDDPEVVRDFVRGGCEIMMIWIEAGLQCWRGPGRYDWSYAERKLEHFERHSGDTRWIIRVRLGLLDPWFGRAYPEEVHNPPAEGRPEDRSVCVIASSAWLREVETLVRDFTAWLRTTRWASRIIGFMLNAGSTEEWLIFDTAETYQGRYHPVYVREFRAWLRRRYPDEAALREAWRDPRTSFDTAGPPAGMMHKGSHIWGLWTLRDPATDRPAIDWYRCLNETLADALIGVCRAAKQAAESPIVAGGFHSYLWWETGVYSYIQEYGHALVQRLAASPWVDFVSDITTYDGRYPGGPGGYLGLPACLNLHGKLHYTEVDLKTSAALSPQEKAAWQALDPSKVPPGTAEPAMPDRVWKWDHNMCPRDDAEDAAVIAREAVHNIMTGTPWWWFDIACHHYQSPAVLAAMKKCSDIGRAATEWDRGSVAEVAFVCSEDTPMYQSAMNGSLLRFEMESAHGLLLDLAARQWGLAGVPFDTYEVHDLAHPDFPGGQCKLLIFVNCAYVSPAAAAGIRRWQGDGRTLLWTYAAACLDDAHFDPALGEEWVGMRLGCRRRREPIRVCIGDGVPAAGVSSVSPSPLEGEGRVRGAVVALPLAGAARPPAVSPSPLEGEGRVRGDSFAVSPGLSALTLGGPSLDFGTESSVGPVFFADDPRAVVLGRLQGSGQAAFAARDHDTWRSVYLSMLNFGPALLRNLSRFSGAHVWIESDDVLFANRSMLCLHTSSAGEKLIRLPCPAVVTDLWSGEKSAGAVAELRFASPAYRTRVWQHGRGGP